MNPSDLFCRRSLRQLALLGLIINLVGSLAAAQDSSPVFVAFEFNAPVVTDRFDPERVRILHDTMSDHLSNHLKITFPYWVFQRGGPSDFPRFRIWLEREGDKWSVQLSLQANQSLPETAWIFELYPPGYIGARGNPPIEELMRDIEDKFHVFLSQPTRTPILHELVESAPLGTEVEFLILTGQARAVLPLQWDRYCLMASAEFLITAQADQFGLVTVDSKGMRKSEIYTPANPQFPGILVEPVLWIPPSGPPTPIQQNLQQLSNLTPLEFRLKSTPQPDNPACRARAGGPPPAIAP